LQGWHRQLELNFGRDGVPVLSPRAFFMERGPARRSGSPRTTCRAAPVAISDASGGTGSERLERQSFAAITAPIAVCSLEQTAWPTPQQGADHRFSLQRPATVPMRMSVPLRTFSAGWKTAIDSGAGCPHARCSRTADDRVFERGMASGSLNEARFILG